MDSSSALARLRSDLSDVEAPYLWSDEELLANIDDAQKRFCFETDGILDNSTVSVVRYQIAVGDEWVQLNPKIVRTIKARRADTGVPVDIIDQLEADRRRWFFDGRPGPVKALIVGLEDDKLRIYPKAAEAFEVVLQVGRLPLTGITDTDQPFEVREEHHLHLLGWAKHLAYLKEDPDTFDKAKADDYEARFIAYCRDAKEVARRRHFKPGTVAYGGL